MYKCYLLLHFISVFNKAIIFFISSVRSTPTANCKETYETSALTMTQWDSVGFSGIWPQQGDAVCCIGLPEYLKKKRSRLDAFLTPLR